MRRGERCGEPCPLIPRKGRGAVMGQGQPTHSRALLEVRQGVPQRAGTRGVPADRGLGESRNSSGSSGKSRSRSNRGKSSRSSYSYCC